MHISLDSKTRIQALAVKSPLGRIGSIDEVANAVTFFASDFASYINGTELYVGRWVEGLKPRMGGTRRL